MEKENYYVYKHTSPSGKVYIGLTKQQPERRWRNGNGYKSNPYFYRAILKYGWENIKHEIIAFNLTDIDAQNLEIELIATYNANDSKYGYNITSGGEHYRHSEHSKQLLSILHTGMKHSEETKKKMSVSRQGSKNAFYNKQHTLESKKKMSKSHLGKQLSEEHKQKLSDNGFYKNKYGKEHNRSISILCVETNSVYFSIREAERLLGISHTMISRCCKGKQKTAGGYHWQYYNEGLVV